jgi:hypothetical protein
MSHLFNDPLQSPVNIDWPLDSHFASKMGAPTFGDSRAGDSDCGTPFAPRTRLKTRTVPSHDAAETCWLSGEKPTQEIESDPGGNVADTSGAGADEAPRLLPKPPPYAGAGVFGAVCHDIDA